MCIGANFVKFKQISRFVSIKQNYSALFIHFVFAVKKQNVSIKSFNLKCFRKFCINFFDTFCE